MGHKINILMREFYEHPERKFSIRELEERTKIPRTTIHRYLKELRKKNLINKDNSQKETSLFEIKKINYYIEELFKSGLIDYLIQSLNPSCIILFGSFRKGESDSESDIDLFIETYSKNKIDLSKYEKKLGHKISLFNETKITKLNKELLNNVVNGIKLYGSFKIK